MAYEKSSLLKCENCCLRFIFEKREQFIYKPMVESGGWGGGPWRDAEEGEVS